MVLLEFHQPQGAAWFDDVSLTNGNEMERNLLAAPGFEEDDPAAVQTQAISEGYEFRVQILLDSVQAATSSAAPAKALPALGQQAEALAASITGKGLAAYFPRELRDLDDTREKLALCARLLAERR